MSHVTASRRPAMQNRAWQQGALRFAEGGQPDNSDIEAYEKRRDKVARQPPDIQSMTHLGQKPQRPAMMETGYWGKVPLGQYDYDVAGPVGALASTAYGLKTLPLYMTPAAPLAAASDLAEGFASGDPLQAGLGALGTPGKAVKAAGTAAATMMPSDAKAMFLGFDKARFAPLDRLRAARQGLAKRAPGQVWEDEGVYVGRDGKPRWELDDSRTRLRLPKEGDVTSLDRAWEHPELFRQYPQLKKVEVGVEEMEPGWGGYFDARQNRIVVSPHTNGPLGVVAHETQHAVQELEGLATGGDGKTIAAYSSLPWRDTQLRLWDKLQRVGAGKMTAAELDQLKAAQDHLTAFKDPNLAPHIEHELYRRSAGEVEARNVEQRLGWDDYERRRTAPWESADIAPNEQYLHPSPIEMGRAVEKMNARVRAVAPQMDDRARLMAYARELGAR